VSTIFAFANNITKWWSSWDRPLNPSSVYGVCTT
jgi:hypothetical protein